MRYREERLRGWHAAFAQTKKVDARQPAQMLTPEAVERAMHLYVMMGAACRCLGKN